MIGIALAWLIWFGLVRAGEASRVAAYVFFVPLVGIVIGAVFLDERLTASLLIGAALIVSGIYLVNRAPSGETRPTLTPHPPLFYPSRVTYTVNRLRKGGPRCG